MLHLEDYARLVVAVRHTADALRREAEFVGQGDRAELLRSRAEACERRAAEMERDMPASCYPSDPHRLASV